MKIFTKPLSRILVVSALLLGTVGMTVPNLVQAQDVTDPVISGISVSAITESSAIIKWNTNEPTSSLVWYRESPSVNLSTNAFIQSAELADEIGLNTSHTVTLNNLKSSTSYMVMVGGKDAAGNQSTSLETVFITLPNQSSGTPDIVSFGTTNVGISTATLNVVADEPVTVRATYWITGSTSPALMVQSAPLKKSHSISLINLSANTQYQAKLTLTDEDGATKDSNLIYFTTENNAGVDITKPIISNVQTKNLMNNSVTLTWTTNEPATSMVWYSSANNAGASTLSLQNSAQSDSTLTREHSVVLSGLSAATQYLFRVGGSDASGNLSQSAEMSFVTRANGVTPPVADTTKPILYNLEINTTGGRSRNARLNWKTNEATTSTVTYSTMADFSSNNQTVSRMAPTRNHVLQLHNMNRRTFYYFRAESRDLAGNVGVETGVIYLP